MLKSLGVLMLTLSLLLASSCASVLNDANKGAKEVGKTGGGVLRIPGSVSEGAAEGIAGEPESNPYKR
jgi:hypothetical protein